MNLPRLFPLLWQTLLCDIRVAHRAIHELLNPLLFFAVVIVLFPLTIDPVPALLRALGPGIVWVAALLAIIWSLDRLFRQDYLDGSLEQLLITPYPLPVLIFAKMAAHWLLIALPLLLVAPLLALLFQMSTHSITVLIATLALGTPTLSLLGALGVALTVSLRQSGLLLVLLVLPLYIPVLIFGANAINAASAGLPVAGQLATLGALLLLALCFAPWAIAAALRIGVN
jgi:heme exporter protein B